MSAFSVDQGASFKWLLAGGGREPGGSNPNEDSVRVANRGWVAFEHILVVEDDKELRDGLCDALALEGYAAVCVGNGEAALQHLATGARPCMILLDLMMPVMDGWTFREEMLKDKELASIPVIVMTAATPPRAAAVAAHAILYKPLHMGDVVDIVQAYCPDGAN